DPVLHQPIRHRLGRHRRDGEDGDLERLGVAVGVEAFQVLYDQASHFGADLANVGVVESNDIEAAAAEPGVVGEGPTQVPGADDGDPTPLDDAELLAYPNPQLLDRVSDATNAVEVEMGEVPPDVGRV